MAIDPSAQIAATARIHEHADIGPQCVVGEFCIIEADVHLGRGNLGSGVNARGGGNLCRRIDGHSSL